ncbi:F-box domain-containing protein [Pochonia chlamydosporia 170]|uniref:F-box domain-containing protein n=1 Tax=Pochonia chlamydosporia 170 TaxID=1380566 RepID=A0A219AS86_METCM|nr:F-box domain-containing protein [Pochonia chlamydosporia 170]OWT43154.1 F-box domain-containing protein [Pochonia chlamydosporia 170]
MKPHSAARRLTPHYEPEQSSLKPNDHEDETTTSKPDILKAGLLSLPPEIHLEISRRLIYPDALSLKQTNRHFYSLVDTGVELKIDWLVSRRKLHLECPNDKGCDLGSDLLLMKRRREHIECDTRPGIGCIVYGTPTCSHRQRSPNRWRSRLHTKLTIEIWWILVALVPIVAAWLWMLAIKQPSVTK